MGEMKKEGQLWIARVRDLSHVWVGGMDDGLNGVGCEGATWLPGTGAVICSPTRMSNASLDTTNSW